MSRHARIRRDASEVQRLAIGVQDHIGEQSALRDLRGECQALGRVLWSANITPRIPVLSRIANDAVMRPCGSRSLAFHPGAHGNGLHRFADTCAPQIIALPLSQAFSSRAIRCSRSPFQWNTHDTTLPRRISRVRGHPPPIDVGMRICDDRSSSWRIRYARAQPAVWSTAIVQLDNQTPMVANCGSLSIHGIHGLGVTFGSAQRRFAMTERFSIA